MTFKSQEEGGGGGGGDVEGEGRRWGEKGGREGEVESYFILLFQIV